MKGVDFAEVRDAILSAFNSSEFDMFLYERLDFDRQNEIGDGSFKLVVTNTIKRAQQEGWDPMLIAEVAAVRPMKEDVQEVYIKYARQIVDEGRQKIVAEGLQKAIEKYRLGPSVVTQTSGALRLPTAVSGTESGLQKAVKPYLPFIDVSLWRERLFKLEGRVCRVEIDGQALGTAFLVGPDALLTNYHVLEGLIKNPALAAKTRFRFDYRILPNGAKSNGALIGLAASDWLLDSTPYTSAERESKPENVEPTQDELDFAFVRLERAFGSEPLTPVNDSAPRGWIAVPDAPPPLTTQPPMPLMILQHPNTEPLKIAVDTAGLFSINSNGTRMRYATNTEPGSSGSPCFDIDWKLVALHHYGDPLHDQAKYNQGIPINMIRDRLKRRHLDYMLGAAME